MYSVLCIEFLATRLAIFTTQEVSKALKTKSLSSYRHLREFLQRNVWLFIQIWTYIIIIIDQ